MDPNYHFLVQQVEAPQFWMFALAQRSRILFRRQEILIVRAKMLVWW